MRSLSLSAYKALARGASAEPEYDRPERPAGGLIWAVIPDEASARAMIYLVERLREVRGPYTLLITYSGSDAPLDASSGALNQPMPVDTQSSAKRFLDYWTPDICIWMGGNLMPILITQSRDAGVAMLLINARADLLDQPLWRWLPSLARDVLSSFDSITADSEDTRKLVRKLDGARRDIPVAGPLQIANTPLPVNEGVYEELTETLAGRPVWLAVNVQTGEMRDVLNAHRASIRIAHRLLLVLVAASVDIGIETRGLLEKDGWRVCHWEDGEIVNEYTQVILVEEPEDLGLWYRISPVSFLASSLISGFGGCDPYAPASLGSAIIYGPNTGRHMSSYTRLAAAGAARIVKDAKGLTRALETMLAADQAAAMAHAGWVTISDGAEMTDQVIELIQDQLDAQEMAL